MSIASVVNEVDGNTGGKFPLHTDRANCDGTVSRERRETPREFGFNDSVFLWLSFYLSPELFSGSVHIRHPRAVLPSAQAAASRTRHSVATVAS
jgi:hypothetical protein